MYEGLHWPSTSANNVDTHPLQQFPSCSLPTTISPLVPQPLVTFFTTPSLSTWTFNLPQIISKCPFSQSSPPAPGTHRSGLKSIVAMLSLPSTLVPLGNSPFEKLLSSDFPLSMIFLPASFCIHDCEVLPSLGELIPGAMRGMLLDLVVEIRRVSCSIRFGVWWYVNLVGMVSLLNSARLKICVVVEETI